MKTSEADTLKAVRDYLEIRDILYIRIHPVRPVNGKNGIVFTKVNPSQKGAPDLLVAKGGYFLALEIKSSIGKQSPDQKSWQDRFEKQGGRYLIIRNIDDLASVWRDMRWK